MPYFNLQVTSTATPERSVFLAGTTIRAYLEALEDVTVSKLRVFRNGTEVTNLDVELCPGDNITLQQRNLNSGRADA